MKTKVYFATNRDNPGTEAEPRFGNRFHKDGPHFYRVGVATVDKVSDDPDAGYQLRRVRLRPESKEGEPLQLGSTAAFRQLQKTMRKGNRDAVVYIHGFANSFESAMARAAQLASAYLIKRPDREAYRPSVFAFSWPSNGAVVPPWQYFSDRDDAEASGKAMARALARLVEFLKAAQGKDVRCDQRVHLVAHSMGNWALRHMVQGFRGLQDEGPLRPIFDNAFLMAADEDDDALEPQNAHKLGLLPRLARRIHVYHGADDGALVVSDKTKFNPDRLGFNGLRTFSGLSARINAIDCALVDKTKLAQLNHQYYRLRPEVIRDVRAVMSGLERPESLPWRETIETGRRYRSRLEAPETRPNEPRAAAN